MLNPQSGHCSATGGTHLLCLEAKKRHHDVIQTTLDGRGKMSMVGALLQKERTEEEGRKREREGEETADGGVLPSSHVASSLSSSRAHLQHKPTGWRRMEKDYAQLKTPFAKNNGSKSVSPRTNEDSARPSLIHKVETTFHLPQVGTWHRELIKLNAALSLPHTKV